MNKKVLFVLSSLIISGSIAQAEQCPPIHGKFSCGTNSAGAANVIFSYNRSESGQDQFQINDPAASVLGYFEPGQSNGVKCLLHNDRPILVFGNQAAYALKKGDDGFDHLQRRMRVKQRNGTYQEVTEICRNTLPASRKKEADRNLMRYQASCSQLSYEQTQLRKIADSNAYVLKILEQNFKELSNPTDATAVASNLMEIDSPLDSRSELSPNKLSTESSNESSTEASNDSYQAMDTTDEKNPSVPSISTTIQKKGREQATLLREVLVRKYVVSNPDHSKTSYTCKFCSASLSSPSLVERHFEEMDQYEKMMGRSTFQSSNCHRPAFQAATNECKQKRNELRTQGKKAARKSSSI